MDIQQMRERRAALLDQRKALSDVVANEERCMSAAEQAQFDQLGVEANQWADEIDRTNAILGEQTALDRVVPRKSYAEAAHGSGRHYSSLTVNDNPQTFFAATGRGDTGGFRSLNEFLAAVGRAGDPQKFGQRDNRLSAMFDRARNLQEFSRETGGYAVPTQFVAELMSVTANLAYKKTPLFTNCLKIPLTSNECNCPIFANFDNSDAPFGIAWEFIPEGDSFPESTINLESVNLHASKAGTTFRVNNEWIADAHPTASTELTVAFVNSLRGWIEKKLWKSTAVVSGALLSGGAVEIDKQANQAAKTIVTENLAEMWSRMLPESYDSCIWVANPQTIPELTTLTVNSGSGGGPVSIMNNQPGAILPPTYSIYSRPLHFTPKLPNLGSAGDIVLLDPSLYILGMREDIVVEASPHARFEYDQVVYRAKCRFDAKPMLRTVVTGEDAVTRGWLVKTAARV